MTNESTTAASAADRPRTWFDRLLTAWRAGFAPPEEPPVLPASPAQSLSQRWRLAKPIVVPARGYVFDFQIEAFLTWYAKEMTEDMLDAWAQQFATVARRDLTRQVADFARFYLPHQASELEIRLNKELSRMRRRYERSGVVLHCRADVRVRLDEQVKAQLRPVLLERLKMESEHELRLRRAHLLDQLTNRWIAVIGRLRRSPLASAAAHLTDAQLASIIDRLVEKEASTTAELAGRLEEALSRSGRVGQPLETHEADEVIRLLNEALSETADGRTSANGGTRR